ncbi:MAG: TauD/TfdA family dioxygenase, partial [Alphaproteobacteria bacterium]
MLNASGRMTPGRPINDATVWGRDDFGPDRKWVKAIPDALIDDIDKGLDRLRDANLHPKALRPEHLPPPGARAFIAEITEAIEAGPGFVLLSGFPTDRYSESDVKLAYSGLMSHFGEIAIQNRIGEYVVDVSDKGRGLGPQARGHYGNKELPFHADGGNAVSLLCLKTAPTGGQSLLVSGAKIYNAVVNERPDLLPILERGFHHHRRDERDPEDPTYTPWRTPVFGYYDDRFHIIYARPSIDNCIAEG